MTGVLALSQVGSAAFASYWPLAAAFVGGIALLAALLIAGRRFSGSRPGHGNVLDINAVGQAHAAAAPQQPRRVA